MQTQDTRQKGTSGPIKMGLEFEEGQGERIRSIYPTNEEPISIRFVKSGWNYGYPTYHVIIEYGDFEQTDYRFMSADEILESFGFDITAEDKPHSVLVTRDEIKENPNYYALGELVQKKANISSDEKILNK
jgi:hypothetical protein